MMKIVATNRVASQPPNGDRLKRRPLVPIDHAWLTVSAKDRKLWPTSLIGETNI